MQDQERHMTPDDTSPSGLDLHRAFQVAPGLHSRLVSLRAIEDKGWGRVSRLPMSLRIVLESMARHCDGRRVTPEQVRELAAWQPRAERRSELPFIVSRVLLPDLSGLPVLNDLAAMRAVAARLGHDPRAIGPVVPADVVVDHAVSVDVHGRPDSLVRNIELEYARNAERLRLLKWAEQAFKHVNVIPPGSGIAHQLNLERLACVVREQDGLCFPDTLVGTDSHTPMVNGMGVLGWGVGGMEATAALLGEPVALLTPDVVGVHVTGRLRAGVTATDLVLVVTERLRRAGVVGKFVEYFGAGAQALSVADRATVANMAADYGATCAYFAADGKTLDYLRATGRDEAQVGLVEAYLRAQGLFGIPAAGACDYSETIELDLSEIGATVAGPSKPEQRLQLAVVKPGFEAFMAQCGASDREPTASAPRHGDILVAAITSCTNTSNPRLMLAAGLLAAKAVTAGLAVRPHVKTSLAPGSRVVGAYLEAAGLMPALESLGFHIVAHGCTTCMGNTGPLLPGLKEAVERDGIVACAVLSGNRNFEARIHESLRANFLMSPPLVVAYALAGTVRIDLAREPLGCGQGGQPVFLRDLWPTEEEIDALLPLALDPARHLAAREQTGVERELWDAVPVGAGALFEWDSGSTYLVEPPFFDSVAESAVALPAVRGARVLALLGHGITTDHITPNSAIRPDTPAGRWLGESKGVTRADLNTYAMRRCNHEVMVRGAFDNPRLANALVGGERGGFTRHAPTGALMPIYDAAMRYREEGVPLVIVAGREWGTGSSRDWAARAPALLGVRAVIACSFERIHRSNLVGMGILPCQLPKGLTPQHLGLDGNERIDIEGLEEGIRPGLALRLCIRFDDDGSARRVPLLLRVDTDLEAAYIRDGGLLPCVLRKQLAWEVS
ncbi:MAG TPA: aconitate hydratase AcnA [Ramlibacter sp.]|nr:aconitate hydratase AcnA [Ramlibacter sp.]